MGVFNEMLISNMLHLKSLLDMPVYLYIVVKVKQLQNYLNC